MCHRHAGRLDTRFGDLKHPFSLEDKRGFRNRCIGLHKAFVVAHALDPRTKDLSTIEDQENIEALKAYILVLMQDEDPPTPMPDTFECPAKAAKKSSEAADYIHQYDEKAATVHPTVSRTPGMSCESELKAYFDAPQMPMVNVDGMVSNPLEWWATYKWVYP